MLFGIEIPFFPRMKNTSSSFSVAALFFFRVGTLEQRSMDCMFGRSLDAILFLNSFKMNMGCDKSCLLTTPFHISVMFCFLSLPLLLSRRISFDINGVCLSFYFLRQLFTNR